MDATPDEMVRVMNSRADRSGPGVFDQRYGPIEEPAFEVQRSFRAARIIGTFERRQIGCCLQLRAVPSGLDWMIVALTAASLVPATWILAVSAVRAWFYDEAWPSELNALAAYGMVVAGLLMLQPFFLRFELSRFTDAVERATGSAAPEQ